MLPNISISNNIYVYLILFCLLFARETNCSSMSAIVYHVQISLNTHFNKKYKRNIAYCRNMEKQELEERNSLPLLMDTHTGRDTHTLYIFLSFHHPAAAHSQTRSSATIHFLAFTHQKSERSLQV